MDIWYSSIQSPSGNILLKSVYKRYLKKRKERGGACTDPELFSSGARSEGFNFRFPGGGGGGGVRGLFCKKKQTKKQNKTKNKYKTNKNTHTKKKTVNAKKNMPYLRILMSLKHSLKSDLYEVIVLNSVNHCFLPTFASIEFYCIQQNPVKISTFFLLKKIHSIPTKVGAPFAIYKCFFKTSLESTIWPTCN